MDSNVNDVAPASNTNYGRATLARPAVVSAAASLWFNGSTIFSIRSGRPWRIFAVNSRQVTSLLRRFLPNFFAAFWYWRGQSMMRLSNIPQQGQQALAQGNHLAVQAAFEKLRELEPGIAEIQRYNLG